MIEIGLKKKTSLAKSEVFFAKKKKKPYSIDYNHNKFNMYET